MPFYTQNRTKKKVTVEAQNSTAAKPTKAEQAADKASGKPAAKQKAAPAAPPAKPPVKLTPDFPIRYLVAIVCAVLLLIFLCVLLSGEGVVLQWIVNFFCGLFGRNLYYMSIPAMLCIIWIQLASRNQRVRMRTFCICAFVFLFGCMSHMVAEPQLTETGFGWIRQLYQTGMTGMSGGVICGGLTELLVTGFGSFFTGSIFVILASLCILWACKLTVRQMARKSVDYCQGRLDAFRASRKVDELPAAEGAADPEEEEPYPDPFVKLVDKVARKIQLKKQAKKKAETVEEDEDLSVLGQPLSERTRRLLERDELNFRTDATNTDPTRFDIPEPVSVVGTEPDLLSDIPVAPAATASVIPEKKVTARDAAKAAVQVEQEITAAQTAPKSDYAFPPIDLLQRPRGRSADGTAEMRENTRRLNETLASFKIEAHIANVTRGPSVTRYEVELEKGVRLNKLTTCADDIALSLGASGVRIAPVPGKISVVGIEVPNQAVTTVSLREVIGSDAFAEAKSKSSIAVGKDIGGRCIIGNIAKFPHMLIAGTTGSGKSVCMNSIIISLLYKSSPEDVKLIMVDPKMVELGIYNGIPHLLIPVVTDPKKAAGSLQWAVTEMMRRYRSMSDAGVRDLESYNSMIDGGEVEGERLPQVVVIIDELADLMLVAAKEVEESICRIAQMGRAAGIHLIIATQRPSADVITGLMKANIPSRIAFAVASARESRIILDTQGAEKLVGKGDMLYSPIGSGKPQRVQGCFVTDAEVEAVATYVKEHFTSTYDQTVMEDIERKAEQTGSKSAPATAFDPDPTPDEAAGDEMLVPAVDVILETNQASVSLLQRRLKLGYARAARIVDEMEEKGIVGPFVGSKPRQILITKDQWEQMKQGKTLVVEKAPEATEDVAVPF